MANDPTCKANATGTKQRRGAMKYIFWGYFVPEQLADTIEDE
jgi:hypothetical protein